MRTQKLVNMINPEILKIKKLKDAEEEIKKLNVNETGVKIMAYKAVHMCVKFKDVETKTANLLKQEMLSRGGDVAVSRKAGSFEAEETDIIIMGTLAQFVRLIKKMKHQSAFECKKMTKELENLLLHNCKIDVEKAPVW